MNGQRLRLLVCFLAPHSVIPESWQRHGETVAVTTGKGDTVEGH